MMSTTGPAATLPHLILSAAQMRRQGFRGDDAGANMGCDQGLKLTLVLPLQHHSNVSVTAMQLSNVRVRNAGLNLPTRPWGVMGDWK